jgi:hypothetical protein
VFSYARGTEKLQRLAKDARGNARAGTPREADEVAAFLRRAGIVVLAAERPSDLCRDPTHMPVFGTAVAGGVCAADQRRPRSSRCADCA